MKSRLSAVMLVAAVALAVPLASATAAPAPSPSSTSRASVADDKLGERLVNSFMSMLQHKDAAALEAFLSPAFQIVRSNGTAATKSEYLASLPDVKSFSQSDFHATRSGSTLVVRNLAVVSVVVDGKQSASTPAARLSVFEKNPKSGRWQMVAHSNFVPFTS